jgi:hypothetical protein
MDDVFQFGHFYRRASPTQSFRDAKKQRRSGQVWGYPARGSDGPEVKAYSGPLEPGVLGIQFDAPVRPEVNFRSGEVRWSIERCGPSAYLKQDDAAKLDVQITHFRYNCKRLTRSKKRP